MAAQTPMGLDAMHEIYLNTLPTSAWAMEDSPFRFSTTFHQVDVIGQVLR